MNPASCMHNSHDSREREGKKHVCDDSLSPHNPQVSVSPRPRICQLERLCFKYRFSILDDPFGNALSYLADRFHRVSSYLLMSTWAICLTSSDIFTCLCRQNHHGWFSRCWRSAYAKRGLQLASLHRGSSYCYRIFTVSSPLKTPSSGH